MGPVSAWMGDCLRAGKLSRYVTSHPGQLSLAIHLWAGSMSTSLGWESNSRSGLALAMRQTIVVYPPTGLTAYEREISTSPTILRSMALLYLYLLPHLQYVATLPCESQKFEFVVIYKKNNPKSCHIWQKKLKRLHELNYATQFSVFIGKFAHQFLWSIPFYKIQIFKHHDLLWSVHENYGSKGTCVTAECMLVKHAVVRLRCTCSFTAH